MIPVDQTKFGDEGNCMVAAIASILERPIEDFDELDRRINEAERDGRNWFRVLTTWMFRTMHVHAIYIYQPAIPGYAPAGYSIAGGISPRDSSAHAVVYLDGRLIHDPHPSRAGLTHIEEYILLLPLVNPRIPAPPITLIDPREKARQLLDYLNVHPHKTVAEGMAAIGFALLTSHD